MSVNKINPITGAPEKIADLVQVSALPTASLSYVGRIFEYVGADDAVNGFTSGYFYKCVEVEDSNPVEYTWTNVLVQPVGADTIVDVNTVPVTGIENVIYRTTDSVSGETSYFAGNATEVETEQLAKYEDIQFIQVETLPTASTSEVGNIYQYVGETNLSFTNGYFYECVEDSGSYNWVEKEVQKNEDVPHWSGTRAEYEAQKDNIPEGAYVALIDDIDSTYESGDYSLNEVNTGKRWIDGKPIYRKVFTDVPFPEEADIVQADATVTARNTVAFPANYISDIVSASFVAIRRDDGSQQHSLPRRWNSGDPETGDNIIIVVDASIYSLGENTAYQIEVRSNRISCNNTTFKARAIIEYTKND